MAKTRVQRPWLPTPKPFESGRVGRRWEGYKGQRWRLFSIWFKIENRFCAVQGCGRESYYTDHRTPVLELIGLGRDPYDPTECQPLCRMHGDQKTGSEGATKKKG